MGQYIGKSAIFYQDLLAIFWLRFFGRQAATPDNAKPETTTTNKTKKKGNPTTRITATTKQTETIQRTGKTRTGVTETKQKTNSNYNNNTTHTTTKQKENDEIGKREHKQK